jgi:hypothetical protein
MEVSQSSDRDSNVDKMMNNDIWTRQISKPTRAINTPGSVDSITKTSSAA